MYQNSDASSFSYYLGSMDISVDWIGCFISYSPNFANE